MRLPSIGDVVDDKFRVERKLGEGGTSTIFEVRHAITDKKFAIKWLSPELAQSELAVELFIHEARVCGRFEHPNAVQIYDICQTHDTYYMLMEFLEGESLEARLQRVQRFSAQEACDILLPCTEALSAAHRVGIVHQDLKPSNIFLCRVEGRAEEVPKVLDFGISNLTHNGHDLSPIAATKQTVSGTPLYMAPEQMRGQHADPRIDIYALGVVLYELVAGQPPFDSDTFADLVARIVESQPTRLDELVQVDPAFAEIVARAMARDVENRFATMRDFADALRPYGTQRPSVAIKPVEGRRSDIPRAPVRSAWKITQPGIVIRSETDAEPAAERGSDATIGSSAALEVESARTAESVNPGATAGGDGAAAGLANSDESVGEAEASNLSATVDAAAAAAELASLSAIVDAAAAAAEFPGSEESVGEAEASNPTAMSEVEAAAEVVNADEILGDVEDATDAAIPVDSEPTADVASPGELAANVASNAATAAEKSEPTPAVDAMRARESRPESVPRVPPITLPPPAAAVLGGGNTLGVAADALGDGTSVDEDAFAARPHMPKSRWIGVVVALGGALLLTWQSLSGEPRVAAPRPVATHTRTAMPPSEVTALREVPAATDTSNRQSDERVYRAQPKLSQATEPVVTQPDAPREKVARRAGTAHASKRSAGSKDNAKRAKRQSAASDLTARLNRGGSGDTRSGLALPAAGLSRQDF